jgi:hypothetical protein
MKRELEFKFQQTENEKTKMQDDIDSLNCKVENLQQ